MPDPLPPKSLGLYRSTCEELHSLCLELEAAKVVLCSMPASARMEEARAALQTSIDELNVSISQLLDSLYTSDSEVYALAVFERNNKCRILIEEGYSRGHIMLNMIKSEVR